jgi:hypothetical protein
MDPRLLGQNRRKGYHLPPSVLDWGQVVGAPILNVNVNVHYVRLARIGRTSCMLWALGDQTFICIILYWQMRYVRQMLSGFLACSLETAIWIRYANSEVRLFAISTEDICTKTKTGGAGMLIGSGIKWRFQLSSIFGVLVVGEIVFSISQKLEFEHLLPCSTKYHSSATMVILPN